MSYKITALLIAATLGISACNNGTPEQTSVAPATDSATASTPTVASTPVVAEIKSSDGAVSFTPNGDFADKLGDAAFGADKNTTLLQYDESRNLTLSVVASGKVKGTAEDFFSSLKKNIEADKTVSNAQIDEAANNQMAYRFTHPEADGKPAANESCITAVSADGVINTACATSTDLSADELKDVVANSLKFN
ncbi:hypothetical protein [Wielerella bovis]|uniref:hypothetical protein n=1 Tax=Wielerella bovis TaxID=2917790 RepID=UPI002018910C|nr:hypothetical protein [Wielerella bovis]ULJ64587.1 hypothetical protein MIS33_10735 [Wielerella bovis]ULJ66876.1 hypothetical protein MIS31_11710 [Wielerella bovis]